MGSVVYTMSEVVMKLKQARQEVNSKYYEYLDPSSNKAANSKLFFNLYNVQSGRTIKGLPAEEVRDDILKTHESLHDAINMMIKLQHVKNTVNNICVITMHDIFSIYHDSEYIDKFTIDDLVAYKDPKVKNFYINLANKLKSDKAYAEKYLENHEKNLFSDMMKHMMDNPSAPSLTNEEFAGLMANYRASNQLEILNPLDIDPIKFEEAVIKFYNTVDYKLMEFNNTTKVWIDFFLTDNYWGFDTCNYQKISY